MKKIMLSMAAVASMMLVACGNTDKKADENANADSTQDVVGVVEGVEVIEIEELNNVEAPAEGEATSLLDKLKGVTSMDAIKENVTKGLAYVKSLVSGGKLTQAKEYLEKLKPYAEKVNLGGAVEKLESGIATAEKASGATEAVDAAKDKVADVNDQVNAGVDAAKEKAADVKDQVNAGVDALKNLGK